MGKMLCHEPKYSDGLKIFQQVEIQLNMTLDQRDYQHQKLMKM